MKIALDFDGVLADPHEMMLDHRGVSDGDFEQWQNDDHEAFVEAMLNVWDEHRVKVPPVEDNIGSKVGQIYVDHDVDIVTNTLADEEVVREWLDRHNVPYDDIVKNPTGTDKSELDYDVYIDDNPNLAGEVDVLYLYDRRWNQTERGLGQYIYHSYEPSYLEAEGKRTDAGSVPKVIRVPSLRHVANDLARAIEA